MQDKFYEDFILTGSIMDYLIYKGIYPAEFPKVDEDGHKAGCNSRED